MRLTAQGPAGSPRSTAGASFGIELSDQVTAGEYVEDVGRLMVSQVNRMLAVLEENLNHNQWDGDAAGAYRKAHDAWVAHHHHLTDALQSIADQLRGNHRVYSRAELDSVYGIGQVPRGLGF